MTTAAVIFVRELKSYLASPVAYVVTAIFLALTGTFFSAYLAGTSYTETSLAGFLDAAQVLILLFAALLTMRLIAEEKKLGTWELLLTSPAREAEIVLGKFAGSFAVLTAMLGLTLYYPLLLVVFGDPDLGPIATSYLGLLLLGGAALAVGLFASSLTSNQVAAAALACGTLFGLWFLGDAETFVAGPAGEALAYLSPAHHFAGFARGIVDSRAVVYYSSVMVFFLYAAARAVEAGRWR